MKNRQTEMQDRRRRLLRYLFKKENKDGSFDPFYQDSIYKKNLVISKFHNQQLEELLRSSTKNVALEVVSCLIPQDKEGILTNIEKM